MRTIFSTNPTTSGISIYWNDEELTIEPYTLQHKQYYCGKDLLKFDTYKTKMYTILVLDLSECYCADVYSDGEIVKRFAEDSLVPNKQGSGGQSAHRFAQNRENAITQWFKLLNRRITDLPGELYLGINHVYERRFIDTLHTYNKAKIKEISRIEYSNLTGIYQYINKLQPTAQNIN